jgi:Uma2 family endonuclease
MPATPLLPPEVSSEALPRKRFTRAEVECLLDSGFFVGQRYELIDGDLIDKMAQKPPHASTIGMVLNWLAGVFGTSRVRVQLPVETAGEDRERSVPEPDLAVLRELKPEYQQRHPRGDELLLVVEVADSSAAFDLSRKAILYARAGVPEYWVVDLGRRMLVVHRQPDGTQYRHIQIHSQDERVSMEGRGESVLVKDILPA